MARRSVKNLEAEIVITGASEHNLQSIDVTIPKNSLVVLSGVSGSGKSSLAFDTLFAEGQRRYVESLSSYARQFLGQMEKPHYERITGLTPTISIEQKTATKNPRSTVGTITEVHDYLRVLYARIGTQFSPATNEPVSRQSSEQIAKAVSSLPKGTKCLVMSPVLNNRKGEHVEILESLRHEGFARVRINGVVTDLDGSTKLKKNQKHTIEVVVDRLVINGLDERLNEAVETALRFGSGRLLLQILNGEERLYSEDLACPVSGRSFPELTPQSFSFNSPLGMCVECNGLGFLLTMDPDKLVPDPSLTIREGAIKPWATRMEKGEGWGFQVIEAISKKHKIDLDRPWSKVPKKHKNMLLYGKGLSALKVGRWHDVSYPGLIPNMERRYRESTSERAKAWYGGFLSNQICSSCEGARLREESRWVRIAGHSICDLVDLTVADCHKTLKELPLQGNEKKIAKELLKEIINRVGFLKDVGLDYLTLSRSGPTLSGGESQRIRLASQVGSELTGVTYVLDEPSIGLHQRDNARLIASLEHLRDIGNTVVVVEHDEETLEAADHLIDFGPGAGVKGGNIVFSGTPAQCKKSKESLTGAYLSGRKAIAIPGERRPGHDLTIKVTGARANNLKNIEAKFPLGQMVAVTGVSGAGKSTLVNGILRPAVARALHGSTDLPGEHDSVEGLEHIDKVIAIDQSPIGRTPRSNPATYVKVFDLVRDLFANLRQSRIAGYRQGRFSFNVKGGRCEACQGDGMRRIEMHFLPDIFVTCEECRGRRYNEATLRVRYKDHTIADILDLTVLEAMELFKAHPPITRKLQTLMDVGLDYLKLGQPSTTLSGGEAQRIKLSRELSKRDTGRTLYLLDEPTTGLHFDDVNKLLEVLARLVDRGNTIVVIEHNLDVIKCADHVIDIGPDGGDSGGEIVAFGTPEHVAKQRRSRTGPFLKTVLGMKIRSQRG